MLHWLSHLVELAQELSQDKYCRFSLGRRSNRIHNNSTGDLGVFDRFQRIQKRVT